MGNERQQKLIFASTERHPRAVVDGKSWQNRDRFLSFEYVFCDGEQYNIDAMKIILKYHCNVDTELAKADHAIKK